MVILALKPPEIRMRKSSVNRNDSSRVRVCVCVGVGGGGRRGEGSLPQAWVITETTATSSRIPDLDPQDTNLRPLHFHPAYAYTGDVHGAGCLPLVLITVRLGGGACFGEVFSI